MPRYHFHVYDGDRFTDRDGVVLPDLDAAKVEAHRFAGEVIRDRAVDADLGRAWRLEVADEADLMLFCIDVVVREPSEALAPP